MATLHYLGIAEPGPGNWSLSFPRFPGTVTTGSTFAELMNHGRDALASVVEATQETGEALPSSLGDDDGQGGYDLSDYHSPRIVAAGVEVRGASVQVNLTMDEGLLARLDNMTRTTGVSRSGLLARGARIVLEVGT